MYSFESNRIKSNHDISESKRIMSWMNRSSPSFNPSISRGWGGGGGWVFVLMDIILELKHYALEIFPKNNSGTSKSSIDLKLQIYMYAQNNDLHHVKFYWLYSTGSIPL